MEGFHEFEQSYGTSLDKGVSTTRAQKLLKHSYSVSSPVPGDFYRGERQIKYTKTGFSVEYLWEAQIIPLIEMSIVNIHFMLLFWC